MLRKIVSGLAICGLMASVLILPASAEHQKGHKATTHGTKTSHSKMHKGKMAKGNMTKCPHCNVKMVSGKCPKCKMTAAQMKKMGAKSGSKASGQKVAMNCPHCNVKMVSGKCPMCGMTAAQMKKDMHDHKSHKM